MIVMHNSRHTGAEKYYFPSISLDRKSPIPLHHQLAQKIKNDLQSKRISAGTQLPPILTFAAKLKLNRDTTRQGYASLEKDNVLKRLPGGRRIIVSQDFEASYKQKYLPAIGIILPDKMESLLKDNSMTALEMVIGIMDTSSEMGFAATPVPLPQSNENFAKFNGWLNEMLSKLNGLIYLGESMGMDHSRAFELLLSQTDLPQVFIGGNAFIEHLGTVTVNMETGMSAALEHLWELGHRKIALLGYKVPVRKIFQLQTIDRLPTLIKLARASFPLSDEDVCFIDYNLNDVPEKLAFLLMRPHCPTAIICTCDKIAVTLQKTLNELPEKHNIAIIGYNDSILASELNLTSICQSYRLSGKSAVEMIIESRKSNIPVNSLNRVVSTSLVIRQSTLSHKFLSGDAK